MLIFLAIFSFAAWIYLGFFRANFWRTYIALPDAPTPAAWPEVAAIIPARDEAETIERVIKAHMASDYPGAFRVILVDDGSSDDTALRAHAAGRAGRLDIAAAPPLPTGWTGKLAAQRAGFERLRETHANARYVLFADADIEFAPQALRRLVAAAEDADLALVSLMARLDSRGAWGGMLIPAFVYFFQMLYPFARANDPRARLAAAAGGCMLVRTDALTAAGGIEALKGAFIDDCALARRLKHEGAGAPRNTFIGLAQGDEIVSRRDNRALRSIWSMGARSAFAQLDHSWGNLFAAVAGLLAVFVAPVLIMLATPFHRDASAGTLGYFAVLIMASTYRPMTTYYRQSAAATLLLPVATLFYAAMTISSGLDHARGKGGRWKGRTYGRLT
jgi:hopene-associated glycosyltransferase HpnB